MGLNLLLFFLLFLPTADADADAESFLTWAGAGIERAGTRQKRKICKLH